MDVTPTFKDGKTAIPDSAIDSVKRNFVALKGPLAVGLLGPQFGQLVAYAHDTHSRPR